MTRLSEALVATASNAVSRAEDGLSSLSSGLLDGAARLYRLDADGELAGLQVEAFVLEEALSQPWRMELSMLHERVDLDLDAMLGRQVTLVTVLADGKVHRRTGSVAQAAADDSDGGFARYRLTVQPWFAFLAQSIRSIPWQEQSVTAIVDDVLSRHADLGRWRWSPCVAELLADAAQGGVRSYCVQYRESDLDFVSRLLSEEGIGYRFEEAEPGDLGPTVVFFADTTSLQTIPEDVSSASAAGGAGIRFHADGVTEAQDTVQAFGGVRGQPVAVLSAFSYDDKSGRVIGAEVPTVGAVGGANAPWLEAYDSAQGHGHADDGDAERRLRLRQQALEARHKCWIGRGVVRSFTAGTAFVLADSMLDLLDGLKPAQDNVKRFLLTRLTHVGVNNLPKEANAAFAGERRGGLAAGDAQATDDPGHLAYRTPLLPPWVEPELLAQATARGYANRFEAIRASVPWRPLPATTASDSPQSGAFGPKPSVPGPLLATVVGPDGQREPSGVEEVHTDRLGRVLIRYGFQDAEPDGAPASTWVRVLQPFAGDGVGTRWLPRIGHEVLVGFFDDDIDRPYVICSLYDGRGAGGASPTPGGAPGADADTSGYAQSSDAAPSAQGNATGGRSPAWHGGSPEPLEQGGQSNAAALSGWKTKEFGGAGFNQLVFDDSTAQLRAQLATTQHASQLSLGHLIHQADNHRGSFRGLGFELRTDAYGALRGGRGVLLSSYATGTEAPAGDNAAGIAMAKQWKTLAEAFSAAAKTHQTVQLSAVLGTGSANASVLDAKAAPAAAWLTQTSGMVAAGAFDAAQADAAGKSTGTETGKLPHGTDAVVDVSAKAGLVMVAGQDAVLTSEENVQLASGGDFDVAVAGALRLHTGQAIGILAGAIKAGTQAVGTGLTLGAGSGDVDVQAQAGTLQVAARDEVKIQSRTAAVDWAAAKKITLSTAGGASIVIEGGNITVMCPGTITVRAGKKSFVGPERVDHPLPTLPFQICVDCLLSAQAAGAPFTPR